MVKRRETTKIIIHSSASDRPEDDSLDAITRLHTSPTDKTIQWGNYTVNGFSWSKCGYHIVIPKNGVAELTNRPLTDIGAHCRGHNSDSIGICLTGDKFFSLAQFYELRVVLDSLYGLFPHLDDSDVYPHNYFNKNKTCPNFNVDDILLKHCCC